MKYILLLAFLIPLFVQAQEESSPDYSEAIKLADIWLDAQKDYENLPGMSVAVVHDQDIIWSKSFGYANMEEMKASSDETLYSICSISKLFTSISIMQLRDAGKFHLDQKVSEVLPWFNLQETYDDAEPITIRSLLTHSSGLPRESAHPYWTGPDFPFPTSEDIKAELGEQESLYAASTRFQYSNLAMSLLGEIVEHVSGMPYEDYVTVNVLEPLRMKNTEPRMPEEKWGDQLSIGYSALNRDGKREKVKLFQANGIAAAAGFSSNCMDLASFAQWQFRLLENGGEEILKASTLKEMQRVHWLNPDWETTWGLGFAVRQYKDMKAVGHGGSCPGYRTQLQLIPEKKLAVIVMFNAQSVPTGQYTSALTDIFLSAMKYEPEEDSPDLAAYSGFYNTQPWGSESVILPWQGKLGIVYLPSENPLNSMSKYEYVEDGIFQRLNDNDTKAEKIRFEKDANGVVTKYWQHNNYRVKLDRT